MQRLLINQMGTLAGISVQMLLERTQIFGTHNCNLSVSTQAPTRMHSMHHLVLCIDPLTLSRLL